MNIGERNELLCKLKLVYLRDNKIPIITKENKFVVESVGFNVEYDRIPNNINLEEVKYFDDCSLSRIAIQTGINKSPGRSKSDVYINGDGYSVKSIQTAPPAIVNHTTRIGFIEASKHCDFDIEFLDNLINKYWQLRKDGIIKEDVHYDHINSPFKGYKNELKSLLNYFLFNGSGQGLSYHQAKYILDFSDPCNTNTWHVLNLNNAVEYMWDRLVFSMRTKGMPANYPNIELGKKTVIDKWTVYFQGGYRGSLHIRMR